MDVVTPQTIRYTLSDGGWIELKQELTVGELHEAQDAIVMEIRADGRVIPSITMAQKSLVVAYLVRWSLRDSQGRVLELPTSFRERLQAVNHLRLARYREIEQLVLTHHERAGKSTAATSGDDSSSGS